RQHNSSDRGRAALASRGGLGTLAGRAGQHTPQTVRVLSPWAVGRGPCGVGRGGRQGHRYWLALGMHPTTNHWLLPTAHGPRPTAHAEPGSARWDNAARPARGERGRWLTSGPISAA